MSGIAIGFVFCRIKGLDAGSEHDGAHIQLDGLVLLEIINGVYSTEFGAYLTPTAFEMNAVISVDSRRIGNGLGIGYINRFSSFQPHVIFGRDRLKRLSTDLFEPDMSRRADRGACPAGHTHIRLEMEGGVHLHIRTASCKT